MKLTITSYATDDQGTFGLGCFDGLAQEWHFLELPWRNNRPDYSCIPRATYRAIAVHSPHFNRMVYLLMDVPDRKAIEMHPANWGGDTLKGWFSNLKGCCAPGKARGVLQPPDRQFAPQKAVLHSSDALNEIFEVTGGADIDIEFRWADNVSIPA